MPRAHSRAAPPPAPHDLPQRAGGSASALRNARMDELRAAWEEARDEFGADEGLALELTTRMGGVRYSSDGND